jgi:hypothetical protein
MTVPRGHSSKDKCELKGPCRKCGRKAWRHEHFCGMRVCPSCKSLDLTRRGSASYKCNNCGALGYADKMSVAERLTWGA